MTIHDERRITDLLHRVDVPASRADIERAMADGAALRRRRRAVLSGGAGVGTVAVAAALTIAVVQLAAPERAGPPDTTTDPSDVATGLPEGNCQPEPLRLPPGGQRVLLAAIDPSGRYVVGHGTVNGAQAGILWTDGSPGVLGGPDVRVRAVSRTGAMVGFRGTRIWLHRDGAWSDLGVNGVPQAINSRGDIVGGDTTGRLVVWPAGHVDQPRVLAGGSTNNLLDYYDIADDGTVAAPTSDDRPRVWAPDGTPRELPMPPGLTGATVTRVSGRWAVGEGYRPDPNLTKDGRSIPLPVPLRWRLDTGTVEELPIANPNGIVDVTAQGVAVFSGVTQPVTLVAPDGTQKQLPKPGDEPRALVEGISDDGRTIAGDAYGIGDESIPYVWRC
jgi:hypothetical protein